MTRVVLYRFAWIKQLRLLLRAKLLQLTAGTTVTSTQGDNGLILDIGDGNTITLIGVTALDEASLVFV